jgi:hypothetical protein
MAMEAQARSEAEEMVEKEREGRENLERGLQRAAEKIEDIGNKLASAQKHAPEGDTPEKGSRPASRVSNDRASDMDESVPSRAIKHASRVNDSPASRVSNDPASDVDESASVDDGPASDVNESASSQTSKPASRVSRGPASNVDEPASSQTDKSAPRAGRKSAPKVKNDPSQTDKSAPRTARKPVQKSEIARRGKSSRSEQKLGEEKKSSWWPKVLGGAALASLVAYLHMNKNKYGWMAKSEDFLAGCAESLVDKVKGVWGYLSGLGDEFGGYNPAVSNEFRKNGINAANAELICGCVKDILAMGGTVSPDVVNKCAAVQAEKSADGAAGAK